jgi:MFS transporter, DHA1 family, inner membrane transport protein
MTGPLIPVLAFSNFVVGMGAFVVIGVLTPVAEGLSLTKAQAGSIMTAYALVYMVASPVLVALTGRLDRKIVLLTGLGVFAGASALSALAPDLVTLWIARAIAACGAGISTPVSAAVALASAPPEQRGRVLASVFGGLTLAQVLGVPAGAWVGYAFDWRAAFALVVVLAIGAMIALALLVRRGLPFQVTTLALLGAALRRPAVLIAVGYTVSFLSAVYVVYTFFAPLFEARLGANREMVSLLLAAFGLGAVVGNILGGRLTDRIGPERTLAILVAAQIVLLPTVALAPGGPIVTGVLVFVWSCCGWSFMVPQQTRLVSIAPDMQNVVLSLNAAGIYLAATVGSAAGAAALSAGGIDALGPVACALALVAALHLWFATRPRA